MKPAFFSRFLPDFNTLNIRLLRGFLSVLLDSIYGDLVTFNSRFPIALQSHPDNPVVGAFEAAALQLIEQHLDQVNEKYPELLQWKLSMENARHS